jgi:hypothetical protein
VLSPRRAAKVWSAVKRPVAGEDGCASCMTGRGRGLSPEQLTHMAEAFVTTTTDPIVATDQTSETFQAILVRPQRYMHSHSPVPSALPQYAAVGEYPRCPEPPASRQQSGHCSASQKLCHGPARNAVSPGKEVSRYSRGVSAVPKYCFTMRPRFALKIQQRFDCWTIAEPPCCHAYSSSK